MVKLIKEASDVRTLVIFMVAILLQIYCVMSFSFDWTAVFYILLFSAAGFWATIANHLHQHNPVFHSHLNNIFLNTLLSLMFGAPATRLHIVHLWNHHAFFDADDFEKSDWSHYRLAGNKKGIFRTLKYVFTASFMMAKNRHLIKTPAVFQKALVSERNFLWLAVILFIYFAPQVFFLLILPGWFLSLSLLLTANLINHDDCATNSQIHHSRDFLSRVENWLFLNSGYHSAHHKMPTKHWSELPKVHSVHFKDKETHVENSFFKYFMLHYFFSVSKEQSETTV